MTTATGRPSTDTDASESEHDETAKGRAQDLAATVRAAASDATDRAPAVASNAYDTLVDAGHTMRSSSNESLTAGTILSFGVTLGLLVGGANRLLVLAALIPAAAMGTTLLERASQARVRTTGDRRPS